MVFFLFRLLSLSLIPIFPAISFIFSLINNSSQFVLGLISSFHEFSSECFLPGEIRIGFHQATDGTESMWPYSPLCLFPDVRPYLPHNFSFHSESVRFCKLSKSQCENPKV